MTETDGNLVRLTIEGMTCDHCVKTVRKAIEAVPGVRSAAVDLDSGSAEVRVMPGWVDHQGLNAAVEKAGYEARIEPQLPTPEGETTAPDPEGTS